MDLFSIETTECEIPLPDNQLSIVKYMYARVQNYACTKVVQSKK